MSAEGGKKGVSTMLLVSLCFNFFLAGIVMLGALRAFGFAHHHPPPVPVRQLLMPQAVRILLPDADQGKIDAIIAAHRDALEKDRAVATDAREAVFRDYDAPKFDASRFAADLEKVRVADGALETETFKAMTETAVSLTPEERATVAQHLKGELWHAHWGHRRP